MINICRICESKNNLINLTINNNEIIKKLIILANISCSQDDELPQFVCQQCQKDLEFSVQFKYKCESTDQKLRNALKLLTIDPLNENSSTIENFLIVKIEEENCGSILLSDVQNEYYDFPDLIKNESVNIELDCEKVKEECEIFSNVSAASSNKLKADITFDCLICKKKFQSKQSLRNHRTIHVPEELRSKIRLLRDKETFQCFICKRMYKNSHGLRNHKYFVHNNNEFKCEICSKKFYCKTSLRRHVSGIHEGIKSFQCYICTRSFNQKHQLDEHIFVHSELRTVQCHLCPYTTKTKSRLTNHLRKSHTKSSNYKPQNKKPRTDGIKIETTFTCELCGKQLKTKSSYIIHIRTHTGEKPYKCDVCDRRFSQSTLLKRHSYTHTGALPYECTICSRKFRSSSNLKAHILTHTGEKPYQCTYCQKSFARRGNLMSHTRVHTGDHRRNVIQAEKAPLPS